MYIRINQSGRIAEINAPFLAFFDLNYRDCIGKTLSDLMINKTKPLSLLKRFFFTSNIDILFKTKIVEYTIKGIQNWVEWSMIQVGEEFVALGKNVTCIKKFEPLIEKQNKILNNHIKNMIASLEYAKNIQGALLPDVTHISENISQFIIYEPKDIVSGDFYWFLSEPDGFIIISIDCTGHGVPGALMTVMVNMLLDEIIKEYGIRNPQQILELLDKKIQQSLSKGDITLADGLDIGVCRFNLYTHKLTFSGAFQNVLIFRDGQCHKLHGGRFPIGFYENFIKSWATEFFDLKFGDRIYMGSDGLADQFGGERSKKLGTKKLVAAIKDSVKLSMKDQHVYLYKFFKDWKGEEEQVDDVTLIGIEVGVLPEFLSYSQENNRQERQQLSLQS
ncbi:MAG: serine/threonine-protein phosphatase [Candidatus Margulisbacteria bacterium]|nr:serine/threonine-protein phosphatase [Candidatus Margulisiibacteriota bacterium]